MEVVFAAWGPVAGKAFVPTAEYLPAAESMRKRGWLFSRVLDNGDTAYGLSPAWADVFKKYAAISGRSADRN